MKKEYLEPVTECVPMLAQSELLNTTSFEGVGLDPATEVDWTINSIPLFEELL